MTAPTPDVSEQERETEIREGAEAMLPHFGGDLNAATKAMEAIYRIQHGEARTHYRALDEDGEPLCGGWANGDTIGEPWPGAVDCPACIAERQRRDAQAKRERLTAELASVAR